MVDKGGENSRPSRLVWSVEMTAISFMSFPYCVGQVPVSYEQFQTGRHFVDGSDVKYVSR